MLAFDQNWNPSRLDIGGEGRADLVESRVDAAGQSLHAENRAKGDQSHDQGVLNQVLTFFASHNGLVVDINLEHQILHFRFLLSLICSSQRPGYIGQSKYRAILINCYESLEINNLRE